MTTSVGARHTTNGGGRSDWQTPPDLFQQMNRRWGFDYDAFASHENALCETYTTADGLFERVINHHYRVGHVDGLSFDWNGRRVFMNPPYTRGFIGAAVEKAFSERNEADLIVGLIPENRDTKWWRSFVKNKASVYSIGRVRYIDPATGEPGGSPPGGSAIVVWLPDWLDR